MDGIFRRYDIDSLIFYQRGCPLVQYHVVFFSLFAERGVLPLTMSYALGYTMKKSIKDINQYSYWI